MHDMTVRHEMHLFANIGWLSYLLNVIFQVSAMCYQLMSDGKQSIVDVGNMAECTSAVGDGNVAAKNGSSRKNNIALITGITGQVIKVLFELRSFGVKSKFM